MKTGSLALVASLVLLTASCDREAPQRIREPSARPVSTVGELPPDSAFAHQVRSAFLHAWDGYREYAWGHDALKPVSRAWRDWYDVSLLMTPIDAYDTMRLMGLDAEAGVAKRIVLERLSFDQDMSVQVFEVTIRLLGGLLSAYQLDGDAGWLELATDLGDRLMPAFGSPTGMPYGRVNLATGETAWAQSNPAEIGTLTLEFGMLSRLTGDPKYFEAVKRAVTAVFERRSPLGLVGTVIDVDTGAWIDPASHVGGRIDSYYEYLLKAWLLFEDEDFLNMWEASRDALNAHVADEVDGRLWYGQVDMATGARTATRFGALDAFLPAVLALGGDIERATRLQESVWFMWETFGVEPESFDYVTLEMGYPGYPLRPEAIESAYYLFVLTGDERFRTMGREMFRRIVEAAHEPVGFAHLSDVRTGEHSDDMESFFLAETLKYAYLLAEPGALDFDAVVFNTEAHPFEAVR